MNNISFDNIYLLLIAVPLILVFLIPFLISVRKVNRNFHNVASFALHIIMAIIIGFAAAGTTFTAVLSRTQVYVVADVSYSANKNLDEVDGYIKNLKLPANSEVGLVCFGKDYELLNKPTELASLDSVKTAEVDVSETDIASALEYTGTLFDEGVIKRVVLITDGKQTDENDTYAIRRAVDSLESQDIKVDAIYLDDNIDEEVHELQISDVQFTSSAYLNSIETAKVTVQSSYDTDSATLVLYKDGEEQLPYKAPTLSVGTNTVTFDLDTSKEGVFSYEVKLLSDDDKSDKNNSFKFTQKVTASMYVLAVTGDWETAKAMAVKYGDGAKVDIYENDPDVRLRDKAEFISLYASDDNVNIYEFGEVSANNLQGVPVRGVPWNIEALCPYDEVVLADIDISTIENSGEFVQNIKSMVSRLGKSLVTFGNLGIQTSDDSNVKELGSILPVQYGKSDDDARLYSIVLDSSRSMNQQFHWSVAKEVAKRILNLLNDDDYICVVTFFGEAVPVQPPVRLGANRAAIAEAIDNLSPRQGTLIGSGLYNAYQLIKDYDYSDKQVMLISDGANFGDDYHDPAEVAADMLDNAIVTSVFDVGRKNGDTGTASETLLRNVAAQGGGLYYQSDNQENLNDNLFVEMAEDLIQQVIEKDTAVRVNRASDEVLNGIDTRAIPQISGFIKGKAQTGAITVLQAQYYRTEHSKVNNIPLYCYWDFGSGRISSFSSSFTGDWVNQWEATDIAGTFIDNVLKSNIPDERNENPFSVDVLRDGGSTRVTLTPVTPRFDAQATIELTTPDGKTVNANLAFDQSYYYYEFDSAGVGEYTIKVAYNYYDLAYGNDNYLTVAYTDEYNEFASFDPAVLFRALNGRGEVNLDGNLVVENDMKEVGTYSVNITIPLLIAVVVLYIIDIIIRKLKWDDIRSFFGRYKKDGGAKV